jgi:hypothetical protein
MGEARTDDEADGEHTRGLLGTQNSLLQGVFRTYAARISIIGQRLMGAEGWMTWVYPEVTGANLLHQSWSFFRAGWPPRACRQDRTGMQESPKLFTEMEEVP